MTTEPYKVHIFGDETSHTGHDYLAYGTMDCPRAELPAITSLLNEAKKGRREFKWSGEMSRDLEHFVDTIFLCRSRHELSFRCMTVKTAHADHHKHNDGDAYLGLEKYIFFHLLGYARRQHVTSNTRFYVVLDKLKDKHTFDGLRRALNFRVRNESGRLFDMYPDVIGVESHTQVLVQAADVLAGCVAWVWNKHYEKRSDSKKVALAQKIATLANLDLSTTARADGVRRGHYLNFGYPTRRNQETHGFAIWEMNLIKEIESEARKKALEHLANFPSDMTFAELAERGFKIGIQCLKCNRRSANLFEFAPSFGRRHLSDKHRPPCKICQKPGILTLRAPAP
jgi:hypothetical protein